MQCSQCGKPLTTKIYPEVTCQSCYIYFHKGGTINPIPPKGVISHDYRGYVVCHICGRAYKRLGSHVKESHKMSIDEYKAKFELCACAKTTESVYSAHMHNLAYKYDMPKQLIEAGKATRVQKGDKTMRKGKQVRLQEILNKKARKYKSQEDNNYAKA